VCSFQIAPLDRAAAAAQLAVLGEAYICGLREPLRFFPKSSFVYTETLRKPPQKGKDDSPENRLFDARREARKAWQTTWSKAPAENNNPAIRCCFGDDADTALDRQFEELAAAIARPFFDNLTGEAGADEEA
jgi:exonuclease V gamma subunit